MALQLDDPEHFGTTQDFPLRLIILSMSDTFPEIPTYLTWLLQLETRGKKILLELHPKLQTSSLYMNDTEKDCVKKLLEDYVYAMVEGRSTSQYIDNLIKDLENLKMSPNTCSRCFYSLVYGKIIPILEIAVLYASVHTWCVQHKLEFNVEGSQDYEKFKNDFK